MRVALVVASLLVGCAATPTRPIASPVVPPPALPDLPTEITVSVVPREELLPIIGVRRLRAIAPSWIVLRARVAPLRPDDSAHELDVDFSLDGERGARLPASGSTLLALAELTGERPHDHVHRYLRTSDAPWPAHVLSFGILTLLTLRVDRVVTPPLEAEVRAVAPRAVALEAALRGSCPRAGGCERLIVLRRPADEAQPLTLVVQATVRGGGELVARRAVVALPDGATLEARLAAVGALRPTERGGGPLSSSDPARVVALAPWPPKALAPIDVLPPPPAPSRPQTPEASAAARPWWASDARRYAPAPPLALLDDTLPVGERVEGAVARCQVGALDIPGDDTDHVYSEVRLGRRWWRVGGREASLSLVTLGPREPLTLALFDWDWLSGDDHLVTLGARRVGGGATWSATFGAPGARRGHATVECRLWGRAAVARATEAAWVRAVDALEGLEADPIAVRPDESDLGAAAAGVGAARDAVEALAGLVGWGDPRVAAAGARWEAGERRYWLAARRAIEALPRDDRGVVTLGAEDPRWPARVRVLRVETVCGAEAAAQVKRSTRASLREADPSWRRAPCVVRVTVANAGEHREYTSSMITARLLLDDGRPLDLASLGHQEVEPGAQAVVSLVAEKGPPPPSLAARPWRLAVRGRGTVELWPAAP